MDVQVVVPDPTVESDAADPVPDDGDDYDDLDPDGNS